VNGLHWLPAAALIVAGVDASATQYASPEEAAQRCFPEATAFKERTLQLMAQATDVPARSASWRLMTAMNGDNVLGVVVFDAVIGKFELIDYAVGIGNDGKVRNVEILVYRESHGYEVRLPAWRKQFVGKDSSARLRVSEDIANISGATMSSAHVTDGVRRIVAVVQLQKSSGKL
jgi:Na+-translocating ferredoxin:NAD+ oxidoreductase RnfG subunit